MKIYGPSIAEGSEVTNLTMPVRTDFPTSPNAGELVYREDLQATYVHNGTDWVVVHDDTLIPRPGIDWTPRSTPADNAWYGVCYGNGLFVAVSISGTGNRAMTSPDGINWTIRSTPADNEWRSVCYGNGLFVAVSYTGTSNRVMTSPDGINWTIRSTPADNSWHSVCYGNGLFVAVSVTGSGNRVMTSPDGINWTIRSTPVDNSWRSVCYGNGLFVAVSDTGTSNRVMTSPDGINWTIRSTPVDNSWAGVCYGNGLFVAVSNTGTGNRVMTSPDGINWTIRSTPADNDWKSVCYGNGLFVAVSDTGSGNRVMTSPDGINWTLRTTPVDNSWRSVCYRNGLFVAVSYTGTSNRVMTSGTTLIATDSTEQNNNIYHGPHHFTSDVTIDGTLNISGNVGVDEISNGTSSVSIPAANGDVIVTTAGSERLRVTTNGISVTNAITGTAVTQSTTDATAGRLYKVGDYTVAARASASDLDTEVIPQRLSLTIHGSGRTNAPPGTTSAQSLLTWSYESSGSRAAQLVATHDDAGRLFFRKSDLAGAWASWVELLHSGNSGSIGLVNGTSDVRIPSANSDIVARTAGTERFRITASGALATGGETAPDVNAGGICINFSGNGFGLTLKNASVAHPFVNNSQTDTFALLRKYNDTNGGVTLDGFSSGSATSVQLRAFAQSPETSNTGVGAVNLVGYKENAGSPGTAIALDNNQNLLAVRNSTTNVLLVKGNGDTIISGGLTSAGTETITTAANVPAQQINGTYRYVWSGVKAASTAVTITLTAPNYLIGKLVFMYNHTNSGSTNSAFAEGYFSTNSTVAVWNETSSNNLAATGTGSITFTTNDTNKTLTIVMPAGNTSPGTFSIIFESTHALTNLTIA